MQAWSGQVPESTLSARHKFPVTIVLLFALAGLIAGFTFGGLTIARPHTSQNNTGQVKKPTPIVQTTITVAPQSTPEDTPLDPPTIVTYSTTLAISNTNGYTFSAQVINKRTHKAIDVTDVTCRLWLTKDLDTTNKALSANNNALLTNVDNFSQPFPQEISGGLAFTTPATQIQSCNAKGPTTWTYTLTSTVQPGTYFLFVVADWKGKHYNWSARQVQVTA